MATMSDEMLEHVNWALNTRRDENRYRLTNAIADIETQRDQAVAALAVRDHDLRQLRARLRRVMGYTALVMDVVEQEGWAISPGDILHPGDLVPIAPAPAPDGGAK